jgi:Protein of unknown function (DUF3179)
VWETTVDGRVLHFHLAGINNQNFIMRDEETGSWWQQVTGEAILGPLKGRRLKSVFVDQLSFSLWKKEKAHGRVLRPDEKILASKQYASADWEKEMARMRIVAGTDKDRRLEPRTLVIGVTLANKSTAYPFTALQKQSPIVDFVGGVPIVLVLGEDNRSVRAFERKVDGRTLEFFKKTDGSNWQLIDSQTGSIWDFNGKAISGTLAGRQLKKVPILEDYWFDWAIYHPDTEVYLIGAQ